MPRNDILEEIYAARETLLAEFEGDVHAYIQNARERAIASGRPIAKPRKPEEGRRPNLVSAATENLTDGDE